MTTEPVTADATRRVRPWIAALLTIFAGWGVGLFYARRTKAAIWLAIANIALAAVLFVCLMTYVVTTKSVPSWMPSDRAVVDIASLVISTFVALGVWSAVNKRQQVDRAGPVRLLGYLAIWLIPWMIALVLAMSVRFAWAQPFRIPAGSMQPTINVGDYVLVSKGAYGYSRFSIAPFQDLAGPGRLYPKQPKRGDLVVFRPEPEPDRDFVKRLVGLPGDRIQMKDGVLFINEVAVPRTLAGAVAPSDNDDLLRAKEFDVYRETLPNGVSYLTIDRFPDGELDNTELYTVPAGHYFVLGDDRDNSADSRVGSLFGYIPFDNLIGRVDLIAHRK